MSREAWGGTQRRLTRATWVLTRFAEIFDRLAFYLLPWMVAGALVVGVWIFLTR